MGSNISVLNAHASLEETDKNSDKVDLVLEIVHNLNERLDSGPSIFKDTVKMDQAVEDQVVVL